VLVCRDGVDCLEAVSVVGHDHIIVVYDCVFVECDVLFVAIGSKVLQLFCLLIDGEFVVWCFFEVVGVVGYLYLDYLCLEIFVGVWIERVYCYFLVCVWVLL